MRAVLDACVLYPTVLREILIGVAQRGLYRPIVSDRIYEEWARAAARRDRSLGQNHNPPQDLIARGEIASLRAQNLADLIPPQPQIETQHHLPDPGDLHVLATAIAGQGSQIVTLNMRDFPRRTLAPLGITAIHPDPFLLALYDDHSGDIETVTTATQTQAEQLSGQSWPIRKLLKKAGLPRLGKRLDKRLDET